ncbi:MAG: preprotein translocase subunit YajC [Pseudomonadota bacterium]
MIGTAYAMGVGPTQGGVQGGSMLLQLLPLFIIFGIFYFLLIRPQQKKAKDQKRFLDNLKIGDQIVTMGGVHGTITGLTDQIITLEIADKVRVKVSRPYVAGPSASQIENAGKETKS